MHYHATYYDNSRMWARLAPRIEDRYTREATPRTAARLQRAEEARDERCANLRAELADLSNDLETRCRFEHAVELTYPDGGRVVRLPEEVANIISNEGYEPFEQCTTVGRFKSSITGDDSVRAVTTVGGLVGALAFLGGLLSFVGSFFKRKTDSPLSCDEEKRRCEMEQERTRTLTAYGFPAADVTRIVRASIGALSVHNITTSVHTTDDVTRTLERYGFVVAQVRRILNTAPVILNRSPQEISDVLRRLETEDIGGGVTRTIDQVREFVLRLPATLV
jgi:hypothetical protein